MAAILKAVCGVCGVCVCGVDEWENQAARGVGDLKQAKARPAPGKGR